MPRNWMSRLLAPTWIGVVNPKFLSFTKEVVCLKPPSLSRSFYKINKEWEQGSEGAALQSDSGS